MTAKQLLRTLLGVALVAAPASGEEPLFREDFEAGDLCAWSARPAEPATAESEPFDSRSNDDAADAEAVSRCAIVEGTIGSLDGDFADFDYYKLSTPEPILLRVTLAERDGASDFEPYADLDDVDQVYPPLGLTPVATASTTRQIFLPAAGDWYLFVADERNWDRDNGVEIVPGEAGGAGGTYRLTLEVVSIEAPALLFPLSDEPLAIPADGSLVIYRLASGLTETLDFAEVFAERLVSASPLDAKLFVVREEIGGRTVIAACDDQSNGGDCDTGLDSLDPRLESIALGADPHLLIVDFYDVYDPQPLPASFELDVQFVSALP